MRAYRRARLQPVLALQRLLRRERVAGLLVGVARRVAADDRPPRPFVAVLADQNANAPTVRRTAKSPKSASEYARILKVALSRLRDIGAGDPSRSRGLPLKGTGAVSPRLLG